jgi:general stress protein 26
MSILSQRTSTKSKKITDKDKRVLEFLNLQRAGVLSTVGKDGLPHASVVYYEVNDDFIFRFLTKKRTQKSNNLRHNNFISFVVFDQMTQTTAQITGEATEIQDLYEVHKVFRNSLRASLHTSENGIPPIAKLDAGDYTAYEISPKYIKMAMFSKPEAGAYEDIFENIEIQLK